MNTYTPKTACIIGSGFAGLSAATFLDSLGYRVTILEKKPVLGGRTYAFKDRRMEKWVDNGQHLLMGAYHETIAFLENIGAKHQLFFQEETDVPLISTALKHSHFRMPNWPAPFNLLGALLSLKFLSWRDKWSFIKLGRTLKKLQKNPDDRSLEKTVSEWLKDQGQSENTRKNFWDMLTLATLNDEPTIAGARMLAVVLFKGLMGTKQDAKMVIPKGNLNDLLCKPAQTFLELRGHTIRTNCGVKKIHILDNKVQGVETDNGEMIKADLYLSAIPFRPLLKIIPEGFVDAFHYFGQISHLKSAPIVSVNLWFEKDFLPYPFVGVADKVVHWYFNKNKIDGVTEGPYHYMAVASGAYSLIELSRHEILEITLRELAFLFPESVHANLIHALVNKEREATLSPTVEAIKYRPKQKTPFDNFYVIGDWTDTGLPATIESAVVSAKLAVEDLQSKNK